MIPATLIQCGRNNNFSEAENKSRRKFWEKVIQIPVRKIKHVSGIKMDNFCVCFGKEIALKNFARVVKKVSKILFL